MEYSHVRPDRRELLDLDGCERVSLMLNDIWVDISPGEHVFRVMNNMANVPRRITAPALLVTGTGGSGKTAIVKEIRRRITRSDGLLFISMASDPDLLKKKEFRSEIYKSLELPCPAVNNKSSISELVTRDLSEILKLRNIWGIVIDEIHDLLLCGKLEQRVNSSMLKAFLGEAYGISLFAFGTPKASSFISAIAETQRRFALIALEDWREDERFRTFLLGVEELLPLRKPSRLYDRDKVSAILAITGGRMDNVMNLIRAAGCYALKDGEESITVEHFALASKDPWGY
ncbi:TniB family NTP-binding protein [Pseudomonas sp. KHB2.9]